MATRSWNGWFAAPFRATPEKLTLAQRWSASTGGRATRDCFCAIFGHGLFITTTAGTAPALFWGSRVPMTGSTPPDLCAETIDLIPGAKFKIHPQGRPPPVSNTAGIPRILADRIFRKA